MDSDTKRRIEYRKKYKVVAKTTKICPNCLGYTIVGLKSSNKKMCADCMHQYDWKLDPGQKSIA